MTPRLRKLFFETLYRHVALYRFASTVPFAGQWRIWQRQVLPRLHGHDVLELGCGPGELLADMLDAGYACQAVERSPQMVRAAGATLNRRHAGTPDLIMQGSARALPFAAHSFDCVVSTFPTEYIYDPATIAEVERVLRPGGRLIVVESAHLLPVGFFQPFLLLIHLLVYGPSALPGAESRERGQEAPGETLETPASDLLIPLEQAGLRRRCEIARSRRWEVCITLGEKA
ncbi:MAG TPA: class I SAM-dependent methyltransferase [Ktedonobacteraceae bacterium]|jgi:SAM-dependent methyltransferase